MKTLNNIIATSKTNFTLFTQFNVFLIESQNPFGSLEVQHKFPYSKFEYKMDKLKYLQPVWWTASLILLMLHVMTKGTAKRINLDFSKIFNQVLQYVDSAQGEEL